MMRYQSSQGISLVELLIALSLGLFLMGGAVQAFLMLKNLYRYQQGISRIQENMQAASHLMGHAIRGAGKFGCVALTKRTERGNRIEKQSFEAYGLLSGGGVVGTTPSALAKNGLLPKAALHRMREDSEVLWVQMGAQNLYSVVQIVSKAGSNHVEQLIVRGVPHFKKKDLIFVGDCQHVQFFWLTDVTTENSQKGRVPSQTVLQFCNQHNLVKLRQQEGQGGQGGQGGSALVVGKVASLLFYVGKTKRKNLQGEPVYALYQTDLNGRTLEYIEGVDAMQLTFGLLDSGGVHYVPQSAVTDWTQVVSVQVALLFTSVEPSLFGLSQDKVMRKWWKEEWSRRNACIERV